ncbi:hypothetical protein [Streptomyces sp. NPDC059757]|uniref:hypothetical protein n=1 Tax=Streptomyces sp. NPDC059757 TaxID=3346935 RepID=UPI0036520A26
MSSKREKRGSMPKEVWMARELLKAPERSLEWRRELFERFGLDPAQLSSQGEYLAESRRDKALYAAIFKAWDEEGVVLHDVIEQAGLTRTARRGELARAGSTAVT